MTSLHAFVRGLERARALPLVFAVCLAGCNGADRITSASEDLPPPVAATPSFNGSFAGGIPFGTFALPTREYGELYNGGLSVIWPKFLLEELKEIKARGGRVVLSLSGNEEHYKEKGHFSLSRWKERVAEYRNIDFSSYIEDGTIIGHYLIDEPNDAHNWNGRPVPGPVVEEMAAYSKQLWPGMATIVRVDPGYLAGWSTPYRHLDAAWAQYVTRKGTARDYIKRNIADAQKLGLALLTGLNIRKGADGGKEMSPNLIESAGKTILEESYPCAFISWQYDARYLGRSDVRGAMQSLAPRARSRSSKSCHRGNRAPPPSEPGNDDDDDDDDDEDDDEEPRENAPPTAAFAPPACTAGVPCRFTDNSRDTDGNLARWSWTFRPEASSDETNPVTTFAEAGTYEVTLMVTDNNGASSSVTRTVTVEPRSLPDTRELQLTLTTYMENGRQRVRLDWSGANGNLVDVYRNGVFRESTRNDGKYIRSPHFRGITFYEYRICEQGASICSNTVTATRGGTGIGSRR